MFASYNEHSLLQESGFCLILGTDIRDVIQCPPDCLGLCPKNPGFTIYHAFIYFHELQIKMPVLAMMNTLSSTNRAKSLDSWDGHGKRYTMNEA